MQNHYTGGGHGLSDYAILAFTLKYWEKPQKISDRTFNNFRSEPGIFQIPYTAMKCFGNQRHRFLMTKIEIISQRLDFYSILTWLIIVDPCHMGLLVRFELPDFWFAGTCKICEAWLIKVKRHRFSLLMCTHASALCSYFATYLPWFHKCSKLIAVLK